MQTTAIRTVANSLPENEVILLTLLISKRYIPYTDLHKKNHSRICRCGFVEQKAAAWFGAVWQNVYLCGVNSGRYGHFDFVT